jgi:RNA polymerase sigma factor (sigma-70 family)
MGSEPVSRRQPMPATALRAPLLRVRFGRLADVRLAELAATGEERAFEELYDRHHAALLGFCRHMLGSREEGEDALQQTFLRAHRALLAHGAPDDVRPWLFAIARNRCRSIHAARKGAATPDAELEPVTDGLAADVEQRSDLRALLADIEQLPEDQRSALVLAELADMPHAEIGAVIGVPAGKVKALVHQARTQLIAERDARETPCEQIREQLATARGGELRRGPLRRHLNRCEPCRAYRRAVAEQRAALGLILPVIPSAGLKEAVLGAIGGGGGGGAAAAAAGSAAGAGAAVSGGGSLGLGAKLVVGAALLGGAGGGTALVETAVVDHHRAPSRASTLAADKAHTERAVAKAPATVPIAATTPDRGAAGGSRQGASAGDDARPGKRKAHAYGHARNGNNGDNGTRDHGASGQANGNGQAKALGRTGQAGSQRATRRAAVDQRNAQRKAANVERRATKRQAKPDTRQPAASGGTGGKAKVKPPEPAATPAPAPTAAPAPVAETAPAPGKSNGQAKQQAAAQPVAAPALP